MCSGRRQAAVSPGDAAGSNVWNEFSPSRCCRTRQRLHRTLWGDMSPGRALHLCGAGLTSSFVDLGMSPLRESYLAAGQTDAPETFYPMHPSQQRE
jgi:hypothetical protein